MGIVFPPYIFFLEFKSKEEMELMPQTVEEHIQKLDNASSDNGSYSSATSDDRQQQQQLSHAHVHVLITN